MYEFSSKEIKKEFKKTEYGKKTNKWLYTSIFIVVFLLVIGIVFGLLLNLGYLKINEAILTLMETLFFISLITMCYFDGKRDGAIEQFKRLKK